MHPQRSPTTGWPPILLPALLSALTTLGFTYLVYGFHLPSFAGLALSLFFLLSIDGTGIFAATSTHSGNGGHHTSDFNIAPRNVNFNARRVLVPSPPSPRAPL